MKRVLRFLQKPSICTKGNVDKNLPRSIKKSQPIGAFSVEYSPTLFGFLASSEACTALKTRDHSLDTAHIVIYHHLQMAKYSQGSIFCSFFLGFLLLMGYADSGGAMKDQIREGYCKESCDYDQSKRVTDQILPHLLSLYEHPKPQDFEIYAPNATFEDPLMHASGVKQIKSAFYAIPKVFSESKIVEYTIRENELSPGKMEILIDNKQHYKFLGKDINMISLIKLYTEDGKVVRHEDCWDKKPLSNRETVKFPLLGRVSEATRKMSMLATHTLMGFGKDHAQ